MAGGAAEEVLLNREPIGTGSDDPEIERLLTNDDELALRREVRRFIASNYPPLLRIADALTRHGVLSGDEVERIVRARR